MVRRINVTGADEIRLAAWEFADPPKGAPEDEKSRQAARTAAGEQDRKVPGVLLLHGLMGRASHWAGTARWLSGRYRAIAIDQRGHGRSDKPGDGPFDRDSYVADAEAAIEELDLAPVALIGHAMGALTAWQLAAKRPDLVQALVVSDMRASALGEQSQREWEEWFKSWPVPFATLGDVRKWFGEDDPLLERSRPSRGEFFAEVMAERADGWRPVFSPRQMLRARETWVYDAHWDELAQVRCPTLVVRGIDGELGRAEAQEMVRVLPRGIYAEVPEAGHLVHYDQPEDWRRVVEPFLQAALPTGS
ncbi:MULTISPECIES: alpha/beta hydrolase [unclassified Streptomyces]|uniref:alpha/beta fold hydrolase n=1 Tax=unclassified Streptomyces TaxID=2593676 RepID=UPI002DD7E94D|nr:MULTISPECIES: alpha/beta hydrolase [unclassified Streptomyces]WSA97242.1 alpha/beta hydrolase [Streptomyces sp. NBC_01795]WSB81674.1 alpha/beta hydrolase [Streptomyces sp. NBC_01775]WSS17566.1 alpha/beta hydrolase [Streptomyces sp. NBC_01186]WSS46313.1 alpha/beta hydrolase [Streptomyces sp. NBC_01187]